MAAHIAWRIAAIILGYFAAVAAACAAFPALLSLIALFIPDNKLWEWLGLGPAAIIVSPVVFVVIAWGAVLFTFVQAMVVNILTEAFAARRLWLHLIVACAVALSGAFVVYADWFMDMDADRWLITAAGLAAALLGGLVYWAIAGRNAGLRPSAAA